MDVRYSAWRLAASFNELHDVQFLFKDIESPI